MVMAFVSLEKFCGPNQSLMFWVKVDTVPSV
jgi:hypothetical protein